MRSPYGTIHICEDENATSLRVQLKRVQFGALRVYSCILYQGFDFPWDSTGAIILRGGSNRFGGRVVEYMCAYTNGTSSITHATAIYPSTHDNAQPFRAESSHVRILRSKTIALFWRSPTVRTHQPELMAKIFTTPKWQLIAIFVPSAETARLSTCLPDVETFTVGP